MLGSGDAIHYSKFARNFRSLSSSELQKQIEYENGLLLLYYYCHDI